MAKLCVKNFGPIKEGYSQNNGFMEISPITIFMGNQCTGKSSIAKIYSTCAWLEKALYRGGYERKGFFVDDFIDLLANQGIKEYLTPKTQIDYIGKAYTFSYKNPSEFSFKENKEDYHCPKIMYIPAERNLVTVLESVRSVQNMPTMLSILLEEYDSALRKLAKNSFPLPVSNIKLKYEESFHSARIVSSNGSEVAINQASSGIQSLAPMSLVSQTLSNEVLASITTRIKTLSNAQRNSIKEFIDINHETALATSLKENFDRLYLTGSEKAVDNEFQETLISTMQNYFNTCFLNIVEEPELNLFPESQANVLYELLECFNKTKDNQLVITTHSPYLISYLTLCTKAAELKTKNVPEQRIEETIPIKSLVAGKNISIYETHNDGSIEKVESYEGLPSDENVLNQLMLETNESFADLLELESEFCK